MINSAQIFGFLLVSGIFESGDSENYFSDEAGNEKADLPRGDTASEILVFDFGEDVEYFPYGETWVHNKATSEQESVTYKFTAKELDVETGLYYYGARYYDPRLSRWISADPALMSYLPTGNKDKDSKLPGHGGVYSSDNLDLYNYGGNNPVKYIDPNGCWKDESVKGGYDNAGVKYTATLNKGTVTKGDTLNKLAEKQLFNEKGNYKFSSDTLKQKIQSIKNINNLKSDTLHEGQKLTLGLSNIKNAGEQGVEPLHAESIAAALGIMKLGGITATTIKVGGPMLGNTAIEMGGNAQGLVQTGGAILLGNAPAFNRFGMGVIDALTPGTPPNQENMNTKSGLMGWSVMQILSKINGD